jgi:hypothetical protein
MEIGFSRKSASLIVGLLLVLSATFAFGQGISTGSISGTVQDPQQAVVSGATVTATNNATNQQFTGTTNTQGFFTLRGVPAGNYTVVVEAPKFTRLKISDVGVNANRDSALGARTLSLGTTEVVTVEGGAPLVETNSAQVTANFQSKTVADLPLYGGFDMLAYFTPGVVSAGSNGFSNNNGADLSVNGQRGRSNNFQIDGQSNNDNSVAGPSIFIGNQDIIAEFNVITNNFGVEYGRNSGSVVNYVTKAGTNAFHGTAFEYYAGNMFDSLANQEKSPLFGFCQPGQPVGTVTDFTGPDGCTAIEKPQKFIENRYGATLGGPILRDKAWFFGSYYGDRQRAFSATGGNSGTLITPTPAGLTTLANAFPGNPAVAALQAFGPHAVTAGNPTVSGATEIHTVSNGITTADVEFAPIDRNVPVLYNDYEVSGRGDIQISSKDRFFARYFFQDNINAGVAGTSPANVAFAQGNWVDIPGRSQQIALDWTRTWSQGFVNQARFSYSRAGFGFEQGAFSNCTRDAITNCPPRISLLGGTNLSFGLNNNLPQGRLINNTQWQDNASWVSGRHAIKFGGEYARQRSPNVFLPNINGTYAYPGLSSGACPVPLSPVNATDCSFSRFLAGINTLTLADGPPKFNFKEQDAAFYIGDDWRMRDNFTLTFGMRWEFFEQAVNLLHDITVLNQAANPPAWDPTLPTSITTIPKIPEDKNNFAPSIGFAWTPRMWQSIFGQDKTVIRGGFRINYEPAYYNIFLNIATAAPVVNLGSVTNAPLPTSGFTGADVQALNLSAIPRGQNPGARNRTDVDPSFHNPYTENWTLGFQRQITNSIAWESRYVGNHTVGNFQTINANPALCAERDDSDVCVAGLAVQFPNLVPAGVTMCENPLAPGFAQGRADCAFNNVRRRTNTAFSIYHGIQNELRLRNWHGLSGGLSYTFSKTIDNVSEIFSTASGATTVAGSQNPFDVDFAERSLSGLDFPHVASLYFTYELPWYKNQQGFAGHLAGGWQISPTWRYSTGQTWTPVQVVGSNSDSDIAFNTAFFGGIDTVRPFMGNSNAPVDTVGQCTDAAAGDCGLVNFFTGDPISFNAVRWIFNDDTAATFFGTPFGNVRRNPGVRGQATNTVNMNVLKNTKLTERFSLRFEAQAYNLFNHQFRGVPDPFIEDGNFLDAKSSFANNFFNSNGGDYSNVVISGIGRRRLVFGLKVIF